jgi:hypothetical protein
MSTYFDTILTPDYTYNAKSTFTRVAQLSTAFSLYRRDKEAELIAKGNVSYSNLSDSTKIIAHMWKDEKDAVKSRYKDLSMKIMRIHRILYPDFVNLTMELNAFGDGAAAAMGKQIASAESMDWSSSLESSSKQPKRPLEEAQDIKEDRGSPSSDATAPDCEPYINNSGSQPKKLKQDSSDISPKALKSQSRTSPNSDKHQLPSPLSQEAAEGIEMNVDGDVSIGGGGKDSSPKSIAKAAVATTDQERLSPVYAAS